MKSKPDETKEILQMILNKAPYTIDFLIKKNYFTDKIKSTQDYRDSRHENTCK